MEKREKILIILMAAAVLYGAMTFVLSAGSEKKVQEKETQDLTAFVTEISSRIGMSRLSEAEAYTIAKAAEEWKANPFVEGEFYSRMQAGDEDSVISNAGGEKNEDEVDAFIYSGYIQVANLKIAIINGVEYEEGDKLEDEDGYVLKKILPHKVILYNGKREESYPLNEDK